MNLICRHFSELTVHEFHRIAMVRCQVFVVEQRNACQEVDETDVVRGFYAKHGFKDVSDVFLENGIPHVMMRL